MDRRLRREQRLSRQEQIDDCYRHGVRISARPLRLHVRRNGLERSRLAISVPGRVCRKAVQRSRWKRLIREAFRLNQSEIGAGLDIVAVPNQPPENLKRQDVEEILLSLLRRRRP